MAPKAVEPQEIHEIRLRDIKVSESNVRQTQLDRGLDELAASIEKLGLLQPVVLLGSPDDDPPYELIVGQRRFLAHKRILQHRGEQWKRIRAVFVGDLDPTQATIRSLVENMHRLDLNHADAAKVITDLYKQYGGRYNRDDKKVARETGLSLVRVRQYIEIEDLASVGMKHKLRARKVGPADVKRALRAAGGNISKAEAYLDLMVNKDLTRTEKVRMVEYARTRPTADPRDVVEEAQKPRVERSVIVSLRDIVRTGLQLAVDAMAMAPEEVAAQAIEEWLTDQGWLGE